MAHYVTSGDTAPVEHFPALVVRIIDRDAGRVQLSIFNERLAMGVVTSATYYPDGVQYADAAPGSWHFIEPPSGAGASRHTDPA
jgi:hypothetical protein